MMNHSVTLSKTVLLSKNIPIADLGALTATPGEKTGRYQPKTQHNLCLTYETYEKETHSMSLALVLVYLTCIKH